MNVLRKISSNNNIFKTAKKTSLLQKFSLNNLVKNERQKCQQKQRQQSSKIEIREQQSYYIIQYEYRGNLLLCKLCKQPLRKHNKNNYSNSYNNSSNKTPVDQQSVKQCIIPITSYNKSSTSGIWLNKKYYFINLKLLQYEYNIFVGIEDDKLMMADDIVMIEDYKKKIILKEKIIKRNQIINRNKYQTIQKSKSKIRNNHSISNYNDSIYYENNNETITNPIRNNTIKIMQKLQI